MDLELIEWLDRQTFPAEVKYGDTGMRNGRTLFSQIR